MTPHWSEVPRPGKLYPVWLSEKEAAAWAQRLASGPDHKVGARGVVERVVDQASVEAAAGVEFLHVGHLEAHVDALRLGLLARDLNHPGRNVVADGLEAVPRGHAGHPAGTAAELAERHPGLQVEQLNCVAEVDEQPRGLAGSVSEGLRPEPLPVGFLDQLRVGSLSLFAITAHGGCYVAMLALGRLSAPYQRGRWYTRS